MAQFSDQVKTIFGQALEIKSSEERNRFLDEACGGNADLRAEVQELLDAIGQADDFLVARERDPAHTQAWSSRESPGTQIGPYKLLQVVGEGGMGTVFMAEQKEPVKRRVALKIIKPGMDTQQVIARFEAERQALALMDHPNIARVLDAGTTASGRPFFVMELVKGVSLSQYCDEQHLTPRQRLELFVPICQAVQHAHQKGIIHRDLKPSNILVAEYDHQPVPKIIDFGVAKAVSQTLTDKTMFTQYGQIVGTLEYMSPEQAKLNQLDIDTRSDIYSLGVILYELLTGTTPFDRRRLRSAAFDELLRIIREEEPPKPSTRVSTTEALASIAANRRVEPHKLGRTLRGELDWIIMKALDKDRARRYDSAIGLADDVQRYLSDEQVAACPPSVAYRGKKFARRHQVALTIATLAVIATLGVVGTVGWMVRDRVAREEEILRERTDREQQIARERESQQKLNEQFVTRALDLSSDYLRERKWEQSLVEAKRAEAAMSSGAVSDELRKRVGERLADLTMVIRLDEIRSLPPEAGTTQPYLEAFRDYGIELEATEIEAAAQAIHRRAIRQELALALDDAASRRVGLRNSPDDATRRLNVRFLQIARRVDTDEWRTQIRDLSERQDLARLKELAERPEIKKQPSATVSMLAWTLKELGARDSAAALLLASYSRRRNDFRVNHVLGSVLADPQEALRYQQAALALRPNSPGLIHNIAGSLLALGRRDEALASYRESLALGGENWKWSKAHVNHARALAADGRLDAAIDSCRAAIELDASDMFAHTMLGTLLSKQGQFAAARECYDRALALPPKEAQELCHLASALVVANRLDESLAAAQKAVELSPGLAAGHFQLGRAMAGKGDVAEAADCYRKAIELDPKSWESHHNLAILLRKQGQIGDAIQYFQSALVIKPTSISTLQELGNTAIAQGMTADGIAYLRRSLEFDPEIQAVRETLGLTLMNAGQLDEAIETFQKSLQLDPSIAIVHNNLGVAFRKNHRLDDAIACFREAIRLDPMHKPSHANLGAALRDQGNLEGAITCFRSAIELNCDDANNYLELADCLWRKGMQDEAILNDRRAHELAPNEFTTNNNLGWRLSRAGQNEAAIELLQKAVALDPMNVKAHVNLAFAWGSLRKTKESAESFRRVIELQPTNVAAHVNLGNLLSDDNKPTEAIASYRRALDLAPNTSIIHYNLGIILHKKTRFDEAIACFRRTIELEPRFSSAHYSLGISLQSQGRLDEALESFRRAVELDPKHAEAHNQLGIILRGQKKYDEALTFFRTALMLQPENVAFLNNVGNTLTDLGQLNDAETALRTALRLNPSYGNTHHNLGVVLMDQGRSSEAVDHLGKAAALGEAKAKTWRLRGVAAMKAGRLADALESFEQAIKLDPDEPALRNDFAWLLATCSDSGRRDPRRAVQLAALAVEPARAFGGYLNTLGVSQYRAEDYAAARNSLHASLTLSGENAVDLFFLAMTYWRLDRQDEAREWFDKGLRLVDQQVDKDSEVVNFRAEAAALLGLANTR